MQEEIKSVLEKHFQTSPAVVEADVSLMRTTNMVCCVKLNHLIKILFFLLTVIKKSRVTPVEDKFGESPDVFHKASPLFLVGIMSVSLLCFLLCLQTHFSLQQSHRQTPRWILQQHPDQETSAESRTGTSTE